MQAQEKAHDEADCRSNDYVVIGLIAIALIAVLGGLILTAMSKTVPDSVWNLAIAIAGNLGGYLQNIVGILRRRFSPAVSTDRVETVNVTNPPTEDKGEEHGG